MYLDFYNANKKILMIYFFITLVIVFDVFPLILALQFDKLSLLEEMNHAWVFFCPLFIEWLISLLTLIVYRCRLISIKRNIRGIVNSNKQKMIGVTENNIKKMFKKLKLKAKYCKHNVFENCLHGIIMFFIPFFLKLTFFQEQLYSRVFLIASALFYIATFVSELVKFIYIKARSGKRKFAYYKRKYPLNQKISMIEENLKKHGSFFSEKALNLFYFLSKLAFGFLFVIYFTQIGCKIDESDDSASWVTLFIPVYLLYVPMIGFSILHFCSLGPIFKNDYWKVILTLFPCICKYSI